MSLSQLTFTRGRAGHREYYPHRARGMGLWSSVNLGSRAGGFGLLALGTRGFEG